MIVMLTLEDMAILSAINSKVIRRIDDPILPPGVLDKIKLVFCLKHLQELDIFFLNQKAVLEHSARNVEANALRAEMFWENVCQHAVIFDEEPPPPSPNNSLHPFWERRFCFDQISDLYREWLECNEKRRIRRSNYEKAVLNRLGQQYKVLTKFSYFK